MSAVRKLQKWMCLWWNLAWEPRKKTKRSLEVNYYILTPPRDLPLQNDLIPLQGDMTICFSLWWSAYVYIYTPPKTCTFNPVDLLCIEVTSLLTERFVVIEDCLLFELKQHPCFVNMWWVRTRKFIKNSMKRWWHEKRLKRKFFWSPCQFPL